MYRRFERHDDFGDRHGFRIIDFQVYRLMLDMMKLQHLGRVLSASLQSPISRRESAETGQSREGAILEGARRDGSSRRGSGPLVTFPAQWHDLSVPVSRSLA